MLVSFMELTKEPLWNLIKGTVETRLKKKRKKKKEF